MATANHIIEKAVDSLLESAGDAADDVRDTALHSLKAHGERERYGKIVLVRCKNFLCGRKPNTTTNAQRTVILQAMTAIIRTVQQLDDLTLSEVIQCGSAEMLACSDITADWPKAASALCVELCERSPRLCTLYLVDSVQSNAVPGYYTIQTLADFAHSSPLRFLPFLKEVYSKLVPLLGMIKQDNQRQVFANAFAQFSDAILQLANRNSDLSPRSKDSGALSKVHFADSSLTVFNVMMNDWSNARELKVRVSVFAALGYLGATVTDDNIIIIIPKLIPAMINAIKREKPKDVYPICEGLAAFLSCCQDAGGIIAPQLEPIFQIVLATLTATTSDKEQSPYHTKTVHGLSRCAEFLTLLNPDIFLTQIGRTLNAKTGAKDPVVRASALSMLRHVISRKNLEPRLEPFKDMIIATIKLAITDNDYLIRKVCIQVIMTMGACAEVSYFEATGATDLILFLIQNASTPTSVINEWNAKNAKSQNALTSPTEIAEMSHQTLQLFTSSNSQKHLDHILWPYLFEHIAAHPTKPEYLLCFPTICRCLSKLAPRIAKTDKYYVDFSIQVNVPRPPVLIAKFLVMASKLTKLADTLAVLSAMENVCPILDEPFVFADAEGNCPTPIATLWLATIPELVKYLKESDPQQVDWEDTLCKLLSKTCACRQEEDWVAGIASAFGAQFPSYVGEPGLARVSLTMLGLSVSKCQRKDFVAAHTDMVLDLAKHNDADHRQGAARGFGYIASQHVDLALDRLATLTKAGEKKGMFAKKEEGKQFEEISRALAAYGLCYAARRMNSSILSSRLEATILPSLSIILSESKLQDVKDSVLGSIPLLQQAIAKIENFTFRGRDSFLELLLGSIAFDNPKANTKPVLTYASAGLSAITALIECCPTPTVSPAIVEKLIKVCVAFLSKVWVGVEESSQEIQECVTRVGNHFCSLLAHVNVKDVIPYLTAVEPFLRSNILSERQRSINVYVTILKYYQKRIEDILREGDGKVEDFKFVAGNVVALLLPRLCDTDASVKKTASEAVVSVFRIHLMVNPTIIDPSVADAAIKEARQSRKRADSLIGDPDKEKIEKEMSGVIKNLCVQIVNIFPTTVHFMPLMTQLLKTSLRDVSEEGSYAACVILHGAVRGLGSTLNEAEQKSFLDLMLTTVSEISSTCKEQTMNGLLLSIRNLCKHNPTNAFGVLLRYPVPHADNIVKAVQTIASDSGLVTLLLNHCMDVILNSQLFEEKVDPKDRKKVTTELASVPLSAACCVGWLCEVAKGAEIAFPMRSAVVSTMFLYLAAAHHIGNNVALVVKSCQLVITALAASDTTKKRMLAQNRWADLQNPALFVYAIADVISFLGREELYPDGEEDKNPQYDDHGQLVLDPIELTQLTSEISAFIQPYVNKPFVYHRKAATAICRQLMRMCVDDKKSIHSLINALLGRCGQDEQADIKVLAVSGIQEISCHSLKLIEHFVSPAIGTLLNGCADASLDVVLGSMASLLHIMDNVPCKGALSAVAVNISSRVKSMFEHSVAQVRTLCFDIFATMLRLSNTDGLEPISMEQFVGISMSAVLVHIEDEEVTVRHAAKKAFDQIVRFIVANYKATQEGKDQLMDILRHITPITTRTKWDEFCNDYAKVWVTAYPSYVNDLMVNTTTFFGSEWSSMRAASALLVGYLVHHIPAEESGRINTEQACFGLSQLINPGKEKNPMVRAKAGRALGLL